MVSDSEAEKDQEWAEEQWERLPQWKQDQIAAARLWHVALLGYDGDGECKMLYANSAQDAAQMRAEGAVTNGDFPLIAGEEVDAIVWDCNLENPARYTIEARSELVYYATKSHKPVPDFALHLDDEDWN